MSERRQYHGDGTVKAGTLEVNTEYTVHRDIHDARIGTRPGLGRSHRPVVTRELDDIEIVELPGVTARERASFKRLKPVLRLAGGSELPIEFDEFGGISLRGHATWAEDEPCERRRGRR